MSGSVAGTGVFFERASAGDQYAQALASLYLSGWRLYDPSLAISRDPEIESKMLRDPDFAGPLEFRANKIAGREWGMAPAEDGAEPEKNLAKVCKKALGCISNFTGSRFNLALFADLSGARYAKVEKRDLVRKFGDGVPRMWRVPVILRDVSKNRFRWRAIGQSGPAPARTVFEYFAIRNTLHNKPDGTTDEKSRVWVEVKANTPLVRHVVDDREENLGYGRGMRDALYFWFLAKTKIFESRMWAADRFGHGQVVMELAHNAAAAPGLDNTELVRQTQANVAKMREKHVYVAPAGDKISILEPSGVGTEFMAKFYDDVRQSIRQYVLAAVNPTGGSSSGSPGSFAKADVEADSTETIIDVRAQMLEETITRDLVQPFVEDNWANLVELGLDKAEPPRFLIVRGRKQDPMAAVTRMKTVLESNVPIKRSQYYELAELEPPGPDDEVVEGIVPTAGTFGDGAAADLDAPGGRQRNTETGNPREGE